MNSSLLYHLLELAPAAWEAAIDPLAAEVPASELDTMRQTLDSLAERAGYLAEYISQRGGCHGCGQRDHAAAAKAARKQQQRVSKALGYTYAARRVFNV